MIEAGRGLAQCLTLLLNIPIGVVKILVPQIAGQQHQALRDRIGLTAPTADKGGDKRCGENHRAWDAGVRRFLECHRRGGEKSSVRLKNLEGDRKGRRKTGG